MSLVECPHCLTRVRPRDDRSCPSCSETIEGKSKSPWKRVTLQGTDRLPALCCRCAAPTDAMMTLTSERVVGGERWWMRILYYLGLAVGTLFMGRSILRAAAGGALPSGAGTATKVQRRLPVCASCERADPPSAEHVDFHSGEITLLVSRKFARELSRARRERREARRSS